MGVATVIVVDVEDRDQSAWAGMTPSDGVMSGWKLIWNEWCPVPSWRFKFHLPGKGQMVSALTWMAHQSNLARLTREGHTVDLYLRPPVLHYKLLDYRLMVRCTARSLAARLGICLRAPAPGPAA